MVWALFPLILLIPTAAQAPTPEPLIMEYYQTAAMRKSDKINKEEARIILQQPLFN